MHRFAKGFVGRREKEGCSEEGQDHHPAHPCECQQGSEDTAAAIVPASREVSPMCVGIRRIPIALRTGVSMRKRIDRTHTVAMLAPTIQKRKRMKSPMISPLKKLTCRCSSLL